MIPGFSKTDLAAICIFLVCWLLYHFLVEHPRLGGLTLNARMNAYRHAWMQEMLKRDNRILDSQIMAALHQGSAFFASTSLIAVGGALSLVRSGDEIAKVFADLPFGASASASVWETKVIGLAIIFIYAFFKFAWAYRLFNYAAILLGAVGSAKEIDAEAQLRAHRASQMIVVAGRHFNRGQRGFFFSLAYLGWFLGPLVFMFATVAALLVMAKRQFGSDALEAIRIELPKPEVAGQSSPLTSPPVPRTTPP